MLHSSVSTVSKTITCNCDNTSSLSLDVQFRFMNGDIMNHGIETINDITESEPFLCVTDRIDCCPPQELGVSNGQWYFPNGSAVPDESGYSFYQASVFAAVRLHRNNGMTNGIYRCDIPDTVGTVQTLHIGIYESDAGKRFICYVYYLKYSADHVICSQ